MPDTGEALKIWQALRPMIDKEIAEQTESCVRAKKMIVKQATVQNDDGSVSLGVAEPYNDKVMVPSGDELSNVNPGSPVWVYWYFNNASTMHVALKGDGTQGSAVTDRLLEMLNKEISDREKADQDLYDHFTDEDNKLYAYIDKTASHLRIEFDDGLNSLRSYVEITASHLRTEFYDDLNSLRSYVEITASHLRTEFYDDMNSLRSYVEITASHLRTEFYDDLNSLRSYVEITASHLRTEFYDDINSLRSYVEITASHLRAEYYDDMNSMRSYVELTASHLRTEFYNDISSLRSYVEITASHLSAEFYDDINSLRSYVEVQAGRIDMNVAATDENSSILRQAGLYINDQGVLVYADDNANMWQSKLNTQADRISLVVSGTGANASIKAAEIVAAINAAGSTVTISADHIVLDGDTVVSVLTGKTISCGGLAVGGDVVCSSLTAYSDISTLEDVYIGGTSIGYNAISGFGTAVESGGAITIPTTTINGTTGPSINFNIADTQFYQDGVAAAAANVTLTGSWSGNTYTVTASNTRTNSETFTAGTGTGNQTAGGQYTISDFNSSHKAYGYVNASSLPSSRLFTFNVDASSEYTTGVTYGQNSIHLAKGAWSGGQVTISKTTAAGYADTSTIQLSLSGSWGSGADANKYSYSILDGQGSTGYTGTIDASAVYNAGVSSGYSSGRNSVTVSNSDIVRDGSDYYNSSTHNTTIYIEATASNGAYGTQSFVVSGASAYAAGQASVSQRTATYVSAGTNLTPDSTGKYLSGTCSVYYDNSTYTPGITLEVNATKAYNAGRNSVTISNSDIVRDGEDYYSSTTHKTTIYVEATASNGESGTQSFTTGTEAYTDGKNSVYVSSWSVDKSDLPTVTVTVTLSNGVVRSHSFNV